ncbi:outer membrane protein assembly factor BamC [Ideonella alba]|uniref:outer membrane protein assembly factor BamC n=1 Tax=Ideonella alba TaxID=2824118 RepID=UPI002873E13D|nr:outer membrane protein assembly factor BamC [Ideonella alba]
MKQAFASTPLRAAVLLMIVGLAGCSALESTLGGDKIDYGRAARKTNPLEVPPDLTPLNRDGRFLPQSGAVSANQLQQAGGSRTAAATAPTAAPNQVGSIRMEREGNTRWLVTPQSPEQLVPRIRQFWQDMGFTLVKDSPETGIFETDWAENRAKIPDDLIRNTLGKIIDSLYSTGERDKFRTRIERTARGTEILISHRGVQEVFSSQTREDNLVWTPRASDPQLEAEMLSRLMLALGAPEQAAKDAKANPAAPAVAAAAPAAVSSRAEELSGQPGAALRVTEDLERTWRRVGLALDRSGFTVEDRDRGQATYFVRFADPSTASEDQPSFFAKLFGAKDAVQLARFRLALKSQPDGSTAVNVLDAEGRPDASENARRVASLLLTELRR